MTVKCINCRNKKTYKMESGRSVDFCSEGYWDRSDSYYVWLQKDNDFEKYINDDRSCPLYDALMPDKENAMSADISEVMGVLRNFSNRTYATLFDVVKIKETCISCAFFNLSLPPTQQYRCRVYPDCIAAVLHPDIIKTFNKVLGWCL